MRTTFSSKDEIFCIACINLLAQGIPTLGPTAVMGGTLFVTGGAAIWNINSDQRNGFGNLEASHSYSEEYARKLVSASLLHRLLFSPGNSSRRIKRGQAHAYLRKPDSRCTDFMVVE